MDWDAPIDQAMYYATAIRMAIESLEAGHTMTEDEVMALYELVWRAEATMKKLYDEGTASHGPGP